ncbi:GGDEF domain-containing protein [Maridesulfovibrio salexigens]|uniref:Diguanylate cyclase/phosphodiesterase n=1 Tax=Maridesulfovibrio salexigens (strain ATCC 14822 / DSM 2638 / NCIMB 8403 / VKM B-1763) TaxID=526222 RepID=C6BXI2_MARSD|nr:GGDEF domain-containing protein [Maridesulfovibrio salexigens]ACS80488.1 diguanylate cyclase/phosphodiesterase [Maridesulfovibrio salexigens DSM 2638]
MLQLLKKKAAEFTESHKEDINILEGPGIGSLIQNVGWLNILYFAIQDFPTLTAMYGPEWAEHLEKRIRTVITKEGQKNLNHSDFHLFSFNAGEFFLLDPTDNMKNSSLQKLAYKFKVKTENKLQSEQIVRTGNNVTINSGHSSFKAEHSNDKLWSNFLSAIGAARLEAQKSLDITNLELSNEFNSILHDSNIRCHYQPIVNLADKSIHGWEALARGPHDSPFRSPLTLFDMAEKLGKLFHLEKQCREAAIKAFGNHGPQHKLFLNIHPRTIVDPNFTTGETKRLLDKWGLKPGNIVFEITERHSVKDFKTFRKTLDHYRNQGYLVAIDDAGTGYSGLTSIAEIKPDYIKMDKSFVDDIEINQVNRALIDTFTDFSEKIGGKLIVEGIETQEQALTLIDMGVHLGQGYFFARPQREKPQLTEESLTLRRTSDLLPNTGIYGIPVKNLVNKVESVETDTPVPMVQQIFKEANALSSIVVVKNNNPCGLVMEYNLNKHLSGKYGVALYSNKPISSVMDDGPLIVDLETTVEKVSQQAMARPRKQAYDDVIVTLQGQLLGTVSVQRLLDTLAHVQVEMAKGTNPLSGLPGNLDIEKEIDRRMKANEKYSIIYADLDNFKVYNDTYGFKNGDKIILQISKIIAWASKKHGANGDFVGHIGGDDFVMVTTPAKAERICKSITRIFKRLVKNNYNENDATNGWMEGKGRDGSISKFPLVSVSLAILDCEPDQHLMEIGEQAASLKKWAKSIEGNCWVRERRRR